MCFYTEIVDTSSYPRLRLFLPLTLSGRLLHAQSCNLIARPHKFYLSICCFLFLLCSFEVVTELMTVLGIVKNVNQWSEFPAGFKKILKLQNLWYKMLNIFQKILKNCKILGRNFGSRCLGISKMQGVTGRITLPSSAHTSKNLIFIRHNFYIKTVNYARIFQWAKIKIWGNFMKTLNKNNKKILGKF